MKVKDIMTKKVISIKPEDNAKDALELLFKMRISGLPVIDAAGKLSGMFTEKEVINTIIPSYAEKVGVYVYEEDPKIVKQKVSNFASLKVKDVMRKEVITTTEETSLCEVAHIMFRQKARRLPVLDKSGNVVGIIARQDVVSAIFRGE